MRQLYLVLVALAIGPVVAAQDSSSVRLASGLQVGVRIRVTNSGTAPDVYIGRFSGMAGDSLRLRPLGAVADTSLSFRRIARIDRSVGDRTLGLQGAGIGMALGFGAGIIAGLASGSDQQSDMPMPSWQKGLLFGIPLGLVGGVIGGVVGRFHHTDKWEAIAVPRWTSQ